MRTDLQLTNGPASGLMGVLDRVLDAGLVVAAWAWPSGAGWPACAPPVTARRALGEGATFTLTLPQLPRDDQ